MQDEKHLIEIWYNGLGDEYRKTRGPLAGTGCHDRPQYRIFYYVAVGLSLLVMAVATFIVSAVLIQLLWLAGICILVGLITSFQAGILLRAALKVKTAMNQGENPDYADPLRFKSFRRAFSWGLKKGKIVKDSDGGFKMTGE